MNFFYPKISTFLILEGGSWQGLIEGLREKLVRGPGREKENIKISIFFQIPENFRVLEFFLIIFFWNFPFFLISDFLVFLNSLKF